MTEPILESALTTARAVLDEVERAVVGKRAVLELVLMGFLADGHVLLDDLPGVAKTLMARSFATATGLSFRRIQFTPDLLPSDITGATLLDQRTQTFSFRPGPLFANLVLADEVNRSPAKVQAALLEAMEERQVTVGGTTHKLPDLFLVMATQNPIEQEGTYPLPEAQMDRFLMHVQVGYPEADAEGRIVALARSEESAAVMADGAEPARLPPDVVFAARRAIHEVVVSDPVERYIVALVQATREPARLDEDLARWIQYGVSPRGSIGLDKVARAHAWLHDRTYVTPEDVQAVVHEVFRHRLILSYEAHASRIAADAVIDRLLQKVAVA